MFEVTVETEKTKQTKVYANRTIASIMAKILSRKNKKAKVVVSPSTDSNAKIQAFNEESMLYAHRFMDFFNNDEKRFLATEYETYVRNKTLNDQWQYFFKTTQGLV